MKRYQSAVEAQQQIIDEANRASERTCRICGGLDGPEYYEDHARCDEIIRLASRPFMVPAGVSAEKAERERIEWAKTQVSK